MHSVPCGVSRRRSKPKPKKSRRGERRAFADQSGRVSSALIPLPQAVSFFDEIDFSDLHLKESEKNFVALLPVCNWNITTTGKKCFPTVKNSQSKANRYANRPHVKEAIQRIREKLWLKGDWTLERAQNYALRMLETIQQGIRESSDPLKYEDSQHKNAILDRSRAVGIWLKRLEYWNETLNRLNGLFKDDRFKDKGEENTRWRELSELSNKELLRLDAAIAAQEATDADVR